MRLTNLLYLVPKLKMSGSIPLALYIPSWRRQGKLYRRLKQKVCLAVSKSNNVWNKDLQNFRQSYFVYDAKLVHSEYI